MTITTILFTDLVGSSELLSRLGDQAARSVFGAHHELTRTAVEANGGELVKWQGDGVMARFQSAADALRSAIAIQRASSRSTRGEQLRVRAGVHVGETLSWEKTDLFGMPVVVARRLCEVADSGQILCSSLIAGLLSGRQDLQFRQVGPITLKGVVEPVAAVELIWGEGEAVHRWSEDESHLFLQLAAVAIPARDEQIATIVSLLPFDTEAKIDVLELGAGEGALAFAILDSYPNAHLLTLDGSPTMRERAEKCVERFGARVNVQPFELAAEDWLPRVNSSNVVVSSLLLHHVPDREKAPLFDAIFERLCEPGALLIADVVEARRREQKGLYADAYDATALAQSLARTGSDEAFKVFSDRHWNVFRYSLPPDEYPSPLIDYLTWLRSAGFDGADCFWMRTGFAVFGGYKGSARSGTGISFVDALRSARLGLAVASDVLEA